MPTPARPRPVQVFIALVPLLLPSGSAGEHWGVIWSGDGYFAASGSVRRWTWNQGARGARLIRWVNEQLAARGAMTDHYVFPPAGTRDGCEPGLSGHFDELHDSAVRFVTGLVPGVGLVLWAQEPQVHE